MNINNEVDVDCLVAVARYKLGLISAEQAQCVIDEHEFRLAIELAENSFKSNL